MSRTGVPGQQDLTDDKMIGGRLVARLSSPLQLSLGASGFYGRMSDKRVVVDSFTPLTVSRPEIMAASEAGLSGDIAADAGPLRFRSEFVLNERRYDEGKRPILLRPKPAPTGELPAARSALRTCASPRTRDWAAPSSMRVLVPMVNLRCVR